MIPEHLDTLFSPVSIAVVGASESQDKPGYAVLYNIVKSGFHGKIFPVNPGKETILGIPCYKGLDDIKEKIDLVVIAIPAKAVITTLETCARLGVGSVVIISAGFRETGHEGLRAERRIAEIAQQNQMRILGPNCLGLIDTFTPMNATFAKDTPSQGKIAFMSQSGALCTSILDISLAEGVGFSCFVSLGNKADLNEIDFLKAWVDHPRVNVVLAYLEGISDGSRFIEVAREFTKKKPIVAIKAGVTSSGSKAVSSHTGALAGSERAYEAAFKQAGVIRARSTLELFDFAVALARQPLPPNGRVAIVTNAGGPGIMATDAIERSGLELAALTDDDDGRPAKGTSPRREHPQPGGPPRRRDDRAISRCDQSRPGRSQCGFRPRYSHAPIHDKDRRDRPGGGRGGRQRENSRARLLHGQGLPRECAEDLRQ